MKKRVLRFFGILFLIALFLFIFQINRFGSISGNIISDSDKFDIENSYQKGDFLYNKLYFQNLEPITKQVKIFYALKDESNRIIRTGSTSYILAPNSQIFHTLKLHNPENEANAITINAFLGDVIIEKTAPINRLNPLTGRVISGYSSYPLSQIIILLLIIFIVVYLTFLKKRKNRLYRLSKNIKRDYICLK